MKILLLFASIHFKGTMIILEEKILDFYEGKGKERELAFASHATHDTQPFYTLAYYIRHPSLTEAALWESARLAYSCPRRPGGQSPDDSAGRFEGGSDSAEQESSNTAPWGRRQRAVDVLMNKNALLIPS